MHLPYSTARAKLCLLTKFGNDRSSGASPNLATDRQTDRRGALNASIDVKFPISLLVSLLLKLAAYLGWW